MNYLAQANLRAARNWLLHVQSDLAVVRRKEWALPISLENAELRVRDALDAAWEAQQAAQPRLLEQLKDRLRAVVQLPAALTIRDDQFEQLAQEMNELRMRPFSDVGKVTAESLRENGCRVFGVPVRAAEGSACSA